MAAAKSAPKRGPKLVDGDPEKSFFTEMLTRDIDLKDAILDLLDNCYDGIARNTPDPKPTEMRPYSKYWAKITCNADQFIIEDNCGGIPKERALHYAFKFGRADKSPSRNFGEGTIGVYGIGMKRAIFKMGTHATVLSQYSANASLNVEIPTDWVSRTKWGFPYTEGTKVLKEKGTKIVIDGLHPAIKDAFSDRTGFLRDLSSAIEQYYSLIMNRGFSIQLNGNPIKQTELRLLVPQELLSKKGNRPREAFKNRILPYKYSGTIQGVAVDIICGFYAPYQVDDKDDFDAIVKASAENAGWTIACNDRVVLFNDKTRLTGWGDATIPLYHAQFRTFTGLVQFRSKDASLLPMNTTKRGVDANSALYLEVRELMRAGLRPFVNFTNKWKSDRRVVQYFRDSVQATLPQIENADIPMRQIRLKPDQAAFNPELPSPPEDNPSARMSFSKPMRQIQKVAKYLNLDLEETSLSEVGEAAFDEVRRLAGSK